MGFTPVKSVSGEACQSRVWIIGSSIIKRAFVHAKLCTTDGVNLDLSRFSSSIWWQGRGGVRIRDVMKQVQKMLSFEKPPKFLILHVGGNDIGAIQLHRLRFDLINILKKIMVLMLFISLPPHFVAVAVTCSICHVAV